MDKADRVLAIFNGDLSLDEAIEAGVTLQDADDAIAMARLDLELSRAERVSWRSLVDEFLRGLVG